MMWTSSIGLDNPKKQDVFKKQKQNCAALEKTNTRFGEKKQKEPPPNAY